MKLLEEFGRRLGQKQMENPGVFFTALALLMIILLPGLGLLLGNIEPSLEKILPQEIEEVKIMNDMRVQYGADMMYIVIEETSPAHDMRDPDVLKYIALLSEKLRENEYILQVNSLADIIKGVNNDIIPESNKEVRELMHLDPRSLSYINHDNSIAIMEIRSDTGATSSVIKRVVDDMKEDIDSLERYNPGVSLKITGFNAIDKATFEVIIADFAYITLFTFLFMLLFLFLYFGGSWRKVLGAIAVIMTSVLATLGATGYLGITITVVTMVAAAMIMALGISYGINVTYDYYRLRERMQKKEALITLNMELVTALIGSSLTTSAGFLALLFGIIPAMKNLGIVLAIGITFTLFISVFFLPVIIYTLEAKHNEKK